VHVPPFKLDSSSSSSSSSSNSKKEETGQSKEEEPQQPQEEEEQTEDAPALRRQEQQEVNLSTPQQLSKKYLPKDTYIPPLPGPAQILGDKDIPKHIRKNKKAADKYVQEEFAKRLQQRNDEVRMLVKRLAVRVKVPRGTAQLGEDARWEFQLRVAKKIYQLYGSPTGHDTRASSK